MDALKHLLKEVEFIGSDRVVVYGAPGPLDTLARIARGLTEHVVLWVREDQIYVPDAYSIADVEEMKDDLVWISFNELPNVLPCLMAGLKTNLAPQNWQEWSYEPSRECGELLDVSSLMGLLGRVQVVTV